MTNLHLCYEGLIFVRINVDTFFSEEVMKATHSTYFVNVGKCGSSEPSFR